MGLYAFKPNNQDKNDQEYSKPIICIKNSDLNL